MSAWSGTTERTLAQSGLRPAVAGVTGLERAHHRLPRLTATVPPFMLTHPPGPIVTNA